MAHREPWIGREDRTNWPGIKDTTKGDWRDNGFMEPLARLRNRLGLGVCAVEGVRDPMWRPCRWQGAKAPL